MKSIHGMLDGSGQNMRSTTSRFLWYAYAWVLETFRMMESPNCTNAEEVTAMAYGLRLRIISEHGVQIPLLRCVTL